MRKNLKTIGEFIVDGSWLVYLVLKKEEGKTEDNRYQTRTRKLYKGVEDIEFNLSKQILDKFKMFNRERWLPKYKPF